MTRFVCRAERALREGDFPEAEQLYRELIARDSHDNKARLGLSLALLKQRNLQAPTIMQLELLSPIRCRRGPTLYWEPRFWPPGISVFL